MNNDDFCSNCIHSEVCKYQDEAKAILQAIKYNVFEIKLECKYYRLKDSPMSRVYTAEMPINR